MVAVEPQGHISLVCDVPAVALQRCVITALKIQSMILVKGCKYLPTANQSRKHQYMLKIQMIQNQNNSRIAILQFHHITAQSLGKNHIHSF